jgi:hypothetical protein
MNPELVKFHLPTTDQFSVAVDNTGNRVDIDRPTVLGRQVNHPSAKRAQRHG